MSTVVSDMQHALEMAGGSIGFSALVLAGLMALWYSKFQNKQVVGCLFWYALTVLITIINPLYLAMIETNLPELLYGNMFLWILPTAPVVLYAGVVAASALKDKGRKILFLFGMMGILILAASTGYSGNNLQPVTNSSYIPEEELQILEMAEQYCEDNNKDRILLWGSQDVMEYARMYNGKFHTLYGKDLWLGGFDSQLHQIYEDKYYAAYLNILHAPYHLEEIEEFAVAHSCNVIILDKLQFEELGVEIPEDLGELLRLEYVGKNYLMYTSLY